MMYATPTRWAAVATLVLHVLVTDVRSGGAGASAASALKPADAHIVSIVRAVS